MEIYKFSCFVRCGNDGEGEMEQLLYCMREDFTIEHTDYDVALDSKTISASLKTLASIYDSDVKFNYKQNCAIVKYIFPGLSDDSIDVIVERLFPEYLEMDDAERLEWLGEIKSTPVLKKIAFLDLSLQEVLEAIGFERCSMERWELVDDPSGVIFRFDTETDMVEEIERRKDPVGEVILRKITLGQFIDRVMDK